MEQRRTERTTDPTDLINANVFPHLFPIELKKMQDSKLVSPNLVNDEFRFLRFRRRGLGKRLGWSIRKVETKNGRERKKERKRDRRVFDLYFEYSSKNVGSARARLARVCLMRGQTVGPVNCALLLLWIREGSNVTERG